MACELFDGIDEKQSHIQPVADYEAAELLRRLTTESSLMNFYGWQARTRNALCHNPLARRTEISKSVKVYLHKFS